MAEGVGFEPTSDFHRCRFSRPVPSTARPPLQPFFKHLRARLNLIGFRRWNRIQYQLVIVASRAIIAEALFARNAYRSCQPCPAGPFGAIQIFEGLY